jgi:hypothetical protein
MNRFIRSPWVILPILLSAVFAVLFYPIVQRRYDPLFSIMYTFAGVCVIWIVYFIRAHIFSSLFTDKQRWDRTAGGN